MTDQSPVNDPLDSAMAAEYTPRGGVYFGRIGVDVWYVALVKGVGKVTFDPAQHGADRRCTAIKLSIDAWKKDGTSFGLDREMIAESREWASIVKPSLRALNVDLRGINGKYVRVDTVPITNAKGEQETYENKTTHEIKGKTTLKFMDVYESRELCEEAYAVYYANDSLDTPASTTPTPADNPRERETAKAFLAPLWTASGKDLARFETLLKSQELVARHFSMQSPEVLALVAAG